MKAFCHVLVGAVLLCASGPAAFAARNFTDHVECLAALDCANSYLRREKNMSVQRGTRMQFDCRGLTKPAIGDVGGSIVFADTYAGADGFFDATAGRVRFLDRSVIPTPRDPGRITMVGGSATTSTSGLTGLGYYFRMAGTNKVIRMIWYGCSYDPIPAPCNAREQARGGYYSYDRPFELSTLGCDTPGAGAGAGCLLPNQIAALTPLPTSVLNESDANELLVHRLEETSDDLGYSINRARNNHNLGRGDGVGMDSHCSVLNDAEAYCRLSQNGGNGFAFLRDEFDRAFEHATRELSGAPACSRAATPPPVLAPSQGPPGSVPATDGTP